MANLNIENRVFDVTPQVPGGYYIWGLMRRPFVFESLAAPALNAKIILTGVSIAIMVVGVDSCPKFTRKVEHQV